jgi:hypothetical protein
MTSLLPKDHGGCGGRKNDDKREYVGTHIADVEYQTIAHRNVDDVDECETKLKSSGNWLFRT